RALPESCCQTFLVSLLPDSGVGLVITHRQTWQSEAAPVARRCLMSLARILSAVAELIVQRSGLVMGLGMEGSTGIGVLGGEITGLGVGLGTEGRTGIGALGGETTGVGAGLGAEGTTGIGTIGGK